MHAIIMGAGEGTRMWPISTMVNKHLLKLGGKPVIRIIVEKLMSAHMHDDDITIVCLKKDEKDYRWEFRDLHFLNFYVIEDNAGTADEFWWAMSDAAKSDTNDFLLHYGDSITDLDYKMLIGAWDRAQPINALIAITQNIKHDYSQVIFQNPAIHETEQVVDIIEKPLLSHPAWTGIGIFNAGYFLRVYTKETRLGKESIDFGFDLLPAMTREGQLFAYQYDGRWFDVGNLRSYQKLYQEYQNKDLNL